MNRTSRIALAFVLCLTVAAPGAAGAASCQPAAAATASADRPHVVDPSADVSTSVWPGGTPAYDVRKVWVSQENEPAAGSRATFAVNLAVDALGDHPAGAAYYVNYTGAEWVGAKALPDGTWRFTWGNHPASVPVIGNAYQDRETVTGKVDTTRDVISITLPTDRLPGPRKDGREVQLDMLYVRAGTAVGVPGAGQPELLHYADTTTNGETCAVVLYPENPDA